MMSRTAQTTMPAPSGSHILHDMETSRNATDSGKLLNGNIDHKTEMSWDDSIKSSREEIRKKGNYLKHTTRTEETVVREANCGSRPESSQKLFTTDLDERVHPRVRHASPSTGIDDSFDDSLFLNHRNFDSTVSGSHTTSNTLTLPERVSSPKFHKVPDEDIVDLIMPSESGSQPKLILFEAPVALKKPTSFRRIGSPSPDSGRHGSSTPLVTDHRQGVSTNIVTSNFKRAESYSQPRKQPVALSHTETKRDLTPRSTVRIQQSPRSGERIISGSATTSSSSKDNKEGENIFL